MSQERKTTEDRVAFLPLAFALGWPLALILSWSLPSGLWFFGAPLVALSWLISGLLGLLLTVVWTIERAWRRVLSMAILPLTALPAFLNFGLVWDTARHTAEHLNLSRVCDEEVQYRMPSPDGSWIAESNLEGCWQDGSVYITLHPAKQRQEIYDRLVANDDAYSDGYSDILLHWIDNDHLEIGFPVESSAEPGPREFRGIRLAYTYFPHDAEEHQKHVEFMAGKVMVAVIIRR